MNGNSLCVLVCDSFKAELGAVAANPAFSGINFATYPARCGRPPLDWSELSQATAALPSGDRAVIGGCCLSAIASSPEASPHRTTATCLDNCFRLVIGKYAVESYLQEGAYLLTPGWLKSWRERIGEWGFDRDGARDFFAESCNKLVLLDTGVASGCQTELEELSRFVARPYQTVPVGIDLMAHHVERSVEQWRRQQEVKRASEYAVAVDLLGLLTGMVDEKEVVQQIFSFCRILFGASDLAYLVIADGEPVRIIRGNGCSGADDDRLLEEGSSLAADHGLLPSESGFLVSVKHDGKVIGAIRCDGIPLPQYRDQYLNLLLSTTGVWGLALNNARSFERIREITRELQGQKRILEGINSIFKAALIDQSDEDLGRMCLAVAEALTESAFGFIGEIGADGTVHDTAISDPGWELCTMYDQSGHRRPPGNFQIHGLYGSVLRDGTSVLSNEPAQHPDSIGVPSGHPPLTAFLAVPLVEDDRVRGILAMGNREGGYGSKELAAAEALAPAIVLAFRRKRDQVALQQANELLEERVAQRTRELAEREAGRLEAERSLHDETLKRLRMSERLREKERMLIQQSRLAALGEMINNIAHQWRQPLNSVGLIVQELQLEYELGQLAAETFDERVVKIMDILRHMSVTIDDFRNFFRPEKEMDDFRVGEVVAKTLSLVRESFKAAAIEVVVDAAADPVVTGYPNEYAQVLLNILLNARDAFVARGTKEGNLISIRIVDGKESAVLSITDNAGGIPEEIIDKIFDPYFTTKGPDKGTGVGLYMAKTIIEKNMNGRLSVCNVDGGAQFSIVVGRRGA